MKTITISKGTLFLWALLNAALISMTASTRGQSGTFNAADPSTKRRDEVIAVLQQEDLHQSEERLLLDNDPLLMWNSIMVTEDGPPAPQMDLETVLSNRRALKVLQTIEGLTSRDQVAACQELFAKAIQVHTNTLADWIRRENDPSLKSTASAQASRLTLLLAMFATADGGHRELLASEFTQLDHFVEEAKSNNSHLPLAAKTDLDTYFPLFFPPDNRAQVNVLRLAAERETNRTLNLLSQVDQQCQQANMRKIELYPQAWDVRSAYVVIDPRFEPSQMDANSGLPTYARYSWNGRDYSDSGQQVQETLIKRLRSIVLR